MGVDCRYKIPLGMSVRDIGEVLSILAGIERYTFGANGEYQAIHKDNLHFAIGDFYAPEMYIITLKAKPERLLVDGKKTHTVYYFSDSGMMVAYSTPFWLAMFHAMLGVIGGKLQYSDDDGQDVWNEMQRAHPPGDQDNEKNYFRWKARLNKIKPLTLQDMKKYRKHAAYDTSEVFGPILETV